MNLSAQKKLELVLAECKCRERFIDVIIRNMGYDHEQKFRKLGQKNYEELVAFQIKNRFILKQKGNW